MIDLVNEEGQEHATGIKVLPPGETRSTSNYDAMVALPESVRLDVKEAHKKAKGL